jgi:hypothetical protein
MTVDEVCVKCGWPEDYFIHRADQHDVDFPTADGTRLVMVKGHDYVAPQQGDA